MTAFYIFIVFLYILSLAVLAFFAVSVLFSWIKGAPYVPTKQKELSTILKAAHLRPQQYMLELGCGDGRVLRTAAKEYGVRGKGIDINPLLTTWAKIKARIQHLNNIEFFTEDVLATNLKKADVIYIFLFPKLVQRIKNKLLHETKDNVQIISHGFEIPFLKHYLTHKIEGSQFSTYFYVIPPQIH